MADGQSKHHAHEFTALYWNPGPHGPQDVHVHDCFDEECDRVLVGAGRKCGGSTTRHVRHTLGRGEIPRMGDDQDHELAERLARTTAAFQPPLLKVIFDELTKRGWKLDGAAYIDPEGNRHGSLEAAIAAQSFREIAAQGDG